MIASDQCSFDALLQYFRVLELLGIVADRDNVIS